jgi:hypothetical protein
MKTNEVKVKVSELKQSPIRQEVLPAGFIVRVQKYKELLGEVEPTSLEEAVSNFQRDLFPERELEIWENIARDYELNTKNNPEMTPEEREGLFGELLK